MKTSTALFSKTIEIKNPLSRPGGWSGVLAVVVLLAVWEILSRLGYLNAYHFPRPTKLMATLWDLATVGFPKGITVWQHIWATIWRILQGYLLAALMAIPLGFVIGQSNLLEKSTSSLITFARSVATISLLPLMVAWFGVGQLSRVLLITYACFWIILTNVIAGVKQIDINLIRAAEMLGCSRRQLFVRVILPASTPQIFTGMKIALGLAFLVIIAVEMIGTEQGLGALIMEARTFYRSDAAMVGMIFMALFGFLLAKILDWTEKRLLPWAPEPEELK